MKKFNFLMLRKYPFVSICFAMVLLFLTGCQTDDSYLNEEAPTQKLPDSENGVIIQTEKTEYPISIQEIIVEI